VNTVPRWLLIVVGVSLTLNLVGLGWVAGRSVTAPHRMVYATDAEEFEFVVEQDGTFSFTGPDGAVIEVPMIPPPHLIADVNIGPGEVATPVAMGEASAGVGRRLGWIVANLPPERRESIEIELHELEEPLLEETEKIFVLREEVREELSRSEFEKQRLEAALARLREQIVVIQADSHRILADVAEDLSEQERASLARRMAASIAERAVIARAAAEAAAADQAEHERIVEEAERAREVDREALTGLAAETEDAAAALAEADDTRLRVYTHRIVLEDARDEEEDETPPE
jgi:uncharacterized membrane protein